MRTSPVSLPTDLSLCRKVIIIGVEGGNGLQATPGADFMQRDCVLLLFKIFLSHFSWRLREID